jgi:SsrA-binding protein
MEAGLVLTGTEVKAARGGQIQLKDAYGEVSGNEAWLVNAHFAKYSHGNMANHEPIRRRKLLMHRSEIVKLQETTRERGLTVVPTDVPEEWPNQGGTGGRQGQIRQAPEQARREMKSGQIRSGPPRRD